ncbi:MAG: hypothetical protein MMC23_002742 [Stictis urceolatum]|nr:hypothetical protein [Stictis urceolata]
MAYTPTYTPTSSLPPSRFPSGRSTPIAQMDPSTTPRILCFHGGGTSAQIFQIQTVRLARLFAPHFRLEFIDGPFVAPPGPGVHPFFEGMGPYYRWARRAPTDNGTLLRERIRAKLAEPGGEWVGVLGFSQGSAMSVGMLVEQERGEARARGEDPEPGREWFGGLMPGGGHTGFKFGVICHGGFPPIRLSEGTTGQPEGVELPWDEAWRGLVGVPTVHVHGLRDFVLERSRMLIQVCREGTARRLEFDIEHRLPVELEQNELIKRHVMEMWREVGGDAAVAEGATAMS